MSQENLVNTTREYYDSSDADSFYYHIWGGEDIHVGIYQSDVEPIFDASRRTVMQMAEMVQVDKNTKVLDIGSGYGGAARFLADKYQCEVWCLNLSEKENERNRQKNQEAGLSEQIHVVDGSFEAIDFPDQTFDVVWSEDALLHSNQKGKVFGEASRVLKPGGDFIFTDPMQSDDCPDGVLQPILNRIHLESMGSVKEYKKMAASVGFAEAEIREMPEQLTNHYSRVLQKLQEEQENIAKVCSEDYLTKMKQGLQHWINGGEKDYLNWGILHFRKGN